MNKEKWIDGIIQSGKNLPPVPANPFLATRIEARLQTMEENPMTSKIPVRWVYVSALAMTVLLLCNVVSWRQTRIPAKTTADIQQVMQEYGWNNNDLYATNFSK
jgi:hypothetical protein